MSPSADPRACRWLGFAGSAALAAGGLACGALPLHALRRHTDLGLVSVYFGLGLLIGAWFLLGRRRVTDEGWLRRTLLLWAGPLALGAPLFSRDVYSYLAQGAMVVADLDVYQQGPAVLGGPLADEVPLIWQHTPAPYGPVFLRVAAEVAKLADADVVLGVIGMRLVALAGVALVVVFLPVLARQCGVHPAAALWLGALNPLVLLHLIAGAHNDALMLGLLVAGLAAATSRRLVVGAVLIALAGLVKAPAAIGLLAVVWLWRRQLPGLAAWAATAGIALVTGIVVTVVAGTGYGWMSALDTPISASNWSLSSALGRLSGDVALWRHLGLLAAVLTACYVWLRRPRLSPVYALGLTLGTLALLGPATRPWYLLWGLVPLAAAAPPGPARRWSAVLCGLLAIVVLPDGYPPTVAQVALATLGGALALVAVWHVASPAREPAW